MNGDPQANKGAGVWRVVRAGLIVLSVIVTLVAIGVGGAVSAQRFDHSTDHFTHKIGSVLPSRSTASAAST